MTIPIDEKTRIRGTPMCWQIEYLEGKPGKKYWAAKKFFPTLRQTLGHLTDVQIRTSEVETLADALAHCQALSGRYTEVLDGLEAIRRRLLEASGDKYR